jgi:hypothetical protein
MPEYLSQGSDPGDAFLAIYTTEYVHKLLEDLSTSLAHYLAHTDEVTRGDNPTLIAGYNVARYLLRYLQRLADWESVD